MFAESFNRTMALGSSAWLVGPEHICQQQVLQDGEVLSCAWLRNQLNVSRHV